MDRMTSAVFLTLVILLQLVSSQDTSRLRTFNFKNMCNQELYIGSWGMFPNGTRYHPMNGGWRMAAGETTTMLIPGLLSATRFWPRTGCKTKNGGAPTLDNPLRCDTGDCWASINNGLQCAGITGQPPATLFEITLTGLGSAKDDTYDVSVVDGYNVGIAVQEVGGTPLGGQYGVGSKYNCGGTQCSFNVNKKCPPELLHMASDGQTVAGCSSICTAVKSNVNNAWLNSIRNGIDSYTGYPLENLVCCDCAAGPGIGCDNAKCQYGCSPHDTSNPGGKCYVEHWPSASTGVRYEDLYQQDCPDSYAWQFADLTSTFHCINADYNIQFCPENAVQTPTSANKMTIVETSATKGISSSTSKGGITISVPEPKPEISVSVPEPTDTPIDPQAINEQDLQSEKLLGLSKTTIAGVATGVGVFILIVVAVAVALVLRRRVKTNNSSIATALYSGTSPTVSTQGFSPTVGTSCMAKYQDGNWYVATVEIVTGDQCCVNYGPNYGNERGWVRTSELRQ